MNQSTESSISIFTILFLIFLVLKLTHYIDWSWWWVTSPLWIGYAVVASIALAWGIVMLLLRGLIR